MSILEAVFDVYFTRSIRSRPSPHSKTKRIFCLPYFPYWQTFASQRARGLLNPNSPDIDQWLDRTGMTIFGINWPATPFPKHRTNNSPLVSCTPDPLNSDYRTLHAS